MNEDKCISCEFRYLCEELEWKENCLQKETPEQIKMEVRREAENNDLC